jgi:hypothetical protein
MIKQPRRPYATLSVFGVTLFHRLNPFIVAWWSAAFPGFGHYLLNQYIRGTLLTLTEFIINSLAHINEAIIYSFCGKFDMAKSVLQPRWVFGYLIIYFYAIWDSYRSAVTQNKLCHLAEMENEKLQVMILHSLEIQYLEQKNPFIAAIFTFLFPGLGQLYNHRFALAFYAMFWWWFYAFFSGVYESLFYFSVGNIQKSIDIINPHWLLFMPSILGGAVYHAFITSIALNRLFIMEQRQYLLEKYANSKVFIFP